MTLPIFGWVVQLANTTALERAYLFGIVISNVTLQERQGRRQGTVGGGSGCRMTAS